MNTIHNIARGVCIKNGNILLAYDREGKYYFLPGGHIEPGESMLETIKREFMEEANVLVEPIRFISIFEHAWVNQNKIQHEINFIFLVAASSMHDIRSEEDHLEFRWIPATEIRNIRFLPTEMLQTVEDVIMNRKGMRFNTTFKVGRRSGL